MSLGRSDHIILKILAAEICIIGFLHILMLNPLLGYEVSQHESHPFIVYNATEQDVPNLPPKEEKHVVPNLPPKEEKHVMIHEEKEGAVLILTPLKDASEHLSKYFDRLEQFGYSKEMTSLGFLVGSSSDDTYQKLLSILEERDLRQHYRRITVVEKPEMINNLSGEERHGRFQQLERRKNIALDRNYLLSVALQDEKHVFWLDSDVQLIPSNIIETMIKADKPIPNCCKADLILIKLPLFVSLAAAVIMVLGEIIRPLAKTKKEVV